MTPRPARRLEVHRALAAQRGLEPLLAEVSGTLPDIASRLHVVEDHRHPVGMARKVLADPLGEGV
jgi:hypothetical protein